MLAVVMPTTLAAGRSTGKLACKQADAVLCRYGRALARNAAPTARGPKATKVSNSPTPL